jgi:hypothetical protein
MNLVAAIAGQNDFPAFSLGKALAWKRRPAPGNFGLVLMAVIM